MSELKEILMTEPAYRRAQIMAAKFDSAITSYNEITTLPVSLRKKLKDIPWFSVVEKCQQVSQIDGTTKAALRLADDSLVETVLMPRFGLKNAGRYSACISTQVGCPMRCDFCATGRLGFKRNLTADEIVDQYRYWQRELGEVGRIENVVFMGQGEPLLNYSALVESIKIFLEYGQVAPRKIVVSTVGVRAGLERVITDDDFPKIRLAISLHSAIDTTRHRIIPSHEKDFFSWLVDWSKKYHRKYTGRNLFIGLEYLMIGGLNDDENHLRALVKLAAKMGRVRINLIAYNSTDALYAAPPEAAIKHFQEVLTAKGFTTTIRRSQGADIDAACGQLALKS